MYQTLYCNMHKNRPPTVFNSWNITPLLVNFVIRFWWLHSWKKLTPRDAVTQVIRFGFQTDIFPWHKCSAYCKRNDLFHALVSLSSFKLRNVTSIQRFKIESTGNFTNKPLHYPMTDSKFFLNATFKGITQLQWKWII